MIDLKKDYDVCVISFSDIKNDARTVNLVRILISLNLKVLVISTANSESDKSDYTLFEENFDNIVINHKHDQRLILKWKKFLSIVKDIIKKKSFSVFWAADLYSLPCAKYFLANSNIRIIYDSREIYSALSTLSNRHITQQIITYIEKKYIKYVDTLVVSGELDAEYLKKYYNLQIPVEVIYNYPDFRPYIESNIIRERLNISNDKTVLIYQGVLLDGRGILPIMKAIKDSNDFILMILGDGTYKNTLIDSINLLNIKDKVFFAGNIDYSELHKWTCSADIGLCNIEPISFSYELALPNKLFEYIQAGLPVLSTDLPALKNVVESYNCGVIISRENAPKAILNSLYYIKNNYKILSENTRKISGKFCYETQIETIKKIISID